MGSQLYEWQILVKGIDGVFRKYLSLALVLFPAATLENENDDPAAGKGLLPRPGFRGKHRMIAATTACLSTVKQNGLALVEPCLLVRCSEGVEIGGDSSRVIHPLPQQLASID
jgi:hypothetical protein